MVLESGSGAGMEKEPAFNVRLTDDVSFIGHLSGGEHFQIFLQNKDGTRLDLSEFTPGYRFMGGWPVTSLTKRFIGFSLAAIQKDPRQIFGLFHEMGHTISHEKRGAMKWPCLLRIAYANAKKEKSASHARAALKEEQRAWAEAFRIARECRDRGFDILALFNNQADIEQWMKEAGLDSYEVFVTRHAKRAARREVSS